MRTSKTLIPSKLPNDFTPNQETMRQRILKHLERQRYNNLSVKQFEITLVITDQSLDEALRVFKANIAILPNFMKISIPFTVDRNIFKIPESQYSDFLEFNCYANTKIQIGSFKFSKTESKIWFECTAHYTSFSDSYLDSLISEYLETSLIIYKSFVCGLYQIKSGSTELQEIVSICIDRTHGRVHITQESEESPSIDEDNSSSNTEDLNNNNLDEHLQQVFNSDPYVTYTLRLWNAPESLIPMPTIIDLIRPYNRDLLGKILETLRELFRHRIKFHKFAVNKVMVKITNNEIEYFLLKNTQKLHFVAAPQIEDCETYIYELLKEINKDLASNRDATSDSVMENYSRFIIQSNKFQFVNIVANEHIIGQGGFGIVYRNVLANIPVAIKLPRNSDNSQKTMQKLLDEFLIIMELNHENIIKTYGFVKINETYGIILEQCMGGSLHTFGRTQTNLTIKLKLEIMIKVAKAIEYMHMKNICHFDIKPQNILLGSNQEPKLTDLGLSRNILEQSNSKPGFTLIYCPPEQIKGRRPDKKSDVWSFGMTLYNFLLQIVPYDYLTEQYKRKLDKNEFYHEIHDLERKPRMTTKFEVEHPTLVKIMNDMWKIDPDKRATSKQVRMALSEYLRTLL